jgi:hypothetical protein
VTDYGNARLGAWRARLLDVAALRRLADAESPAAFLAILERRDDWRPILHEVAPPGAEPGTAAASAIERYRSERLAALPGWYEPPARPLVEALVMGIDAERALAILRRRRAGESPEAIVATLTGGALLGRAVLARLARAPGSAAAIGLLVRFGLLLPDDGPGLVAAAADAPSDRFERAYADAIRRARLERAAGAGDAAAFVRATLDEESTIRDLVAREAAAIEVGVAGAADHERTAVLGWLDGITRRSRRDPLGMAAVAGYVAALEAMTIRLRAALARVRDAWPAELVGSYLAFGRA